MLSTRLEKSLSVYLSIGVAITILIVTTFISIEPVNTPKQIVTVMLGIACWGVLGFNIKVLKLFSEYKHLSLFVNCFVALSLMNIFLSEAPAVQTFYGSFGRSTGAVTYFALAGILLLYSTFRLMKSFKLLIYAIVISGIVNIFYCGVDIFGTDLLGWNNTYGAILGTLGNPNFISSFLGISAITAFPFALTKQSSWYLRLAIFGLILVSLFEIIKSNSKQGIIVLVLGLMVTIYLLFASSQKLKKYSGYYLAFSGVIGVLGILGMLQIGPLTRLLYKTSVSLRGVYWQTGVAMGNANPLTGIGFDSYGDYYREFRNAQAMILPGPSVVTNSAHNVFIEIFAAGGYPLLISYVGIFSFGLIAVAKIIRNSTQFDPVASALIAGWLGYQAQSVISINQIGLAICGWALTGALIGYAATQKGLEESNSKSNGLRKSGGRNSVIPAVLGSLVGLSIALPPFLVDAGWRSALNRGDGVAIIKNATQWPKNTYRLTNIAFALENSNLRDDAITVARENVRFNPRSYDAWKLLIQLSKSTQEEKENGLVILRKLDPLNTDLK